MSELAAVTAERNRAQQACEQMGARIAKLETMFGNFDRVADRLGYLYQLVGALQYQHNLGHDCTIILNEVAALVEEVERISDRKTREGL